MATFEDRENKRKKSIVGALISDEQVSDGSVDETLLDEAKKAEIQDIIVIVNKKEETRSKRVNLLLPPSVYDKAQKKCKKLGISLNECVNQFLSVWVE